MVTIEKTPPAPEPSSSPPRGLGVRHLQTSLTFFCYLLNFMGRINCSFALVAMTNAEAANPDFEEYKWNEEQISYIISSANIGAVLTAIPGSLMCRKFGIKTTMAVSMFVPSILLLVTPISIPFGGWQIYCVIRFMQGIFQGLFFACPAQQLANWAPPNEVTSLGAFVYNGVSVGIVLAMLTSGFIAKSSWGWPGISYFAGALGLIWNVIWQFLGADSPATSKYISPAEKDFILQMQKKSDGAQHEVPIPWKAIFTSTPFLSYLILSAGAYWGYVTILFELPLYMEGVLDMDIKSNSIFSSIPFVALFVMSIVFLYIFDLLMKAYSINISKKIINTFSTWIPAAALIWVGCLDVDQKNLAVVLIVIVVSVNAGITIGSGMNHIELSPNHASFLGSISVAVKGIVSIIVPLFVGIVVNNKNNRHQWQIVFTVAAVMYFLGNLHYLIYGTTSRQSWDREDFLNPNQEIEIKCENQQDDFKSELNELIEKRILLAK